MSGKTNCTFHFTSWFGIWPAPDEFITVFVKLTSISALDWKSKPVGKFSSAKLCPKLTSAFTSKSYPFNMFPKANLPPSITSKALAFNGTSSNNFADSDGAIISVASLL